jgi:hypothetical protein
VDVDMDPPTSSGEKRPSLTPRTSSESSAKRAKLDVPDNQLISINEQMNVISNEDKWPTILENANKNPEQMPRLSSNILVALTGVLSTTDAKDTILAEPTVSQAKSLVQRFDSKELKEWEAGLRKGVNERDWTDLITHRMYHSSPDGRVAFDHSNRET